MAVDEIFHKGERIWARLSASPQPAVEHADTWWPARVISVVRDRQGIEEVTAVVTEGPHEGDNVSDTNGIAERLTHAPPG